MRSVSLLLSALCPLAGAAPDAYLARTAVTTSNAPDLHRVGNRLVDQQTGETVVLKGMSMMGSEYQCVKGGGVFTSPADDRLVEALQSWGVNALRLPMNEDCWLGVHEPVTKGEDYRGPFIDFVDKLLDAGIVVVLDLHWTSHTDSTASGQDQFLSANSIEFWADVAAHPSLGNRAGVVFELFNEPERFSGSSGLSADCFKTGEGCDYAGFNQVVAAIRDAGAKNLVLFSGPQWSFDLPFLQENFPQDPLGNCGVAWHPYEFKCHDFSCKTSASGLHAEYPIFVTEWAPGYDQKGTTSEPDAYTAAMMAWADAAPGTVHLYPWSWTPGGGHNRVLDKGSDWYGSVPTAWGAEYKSWTPARTQSLV